MKEQKKKKILLAEDSQSLCEKILAHPKASQYTFQQVYTGPEVLKVIDLFQPDIVLLGLLLPGMHAIEILKNLKFSETEFQSAGIIITTNEIMMQNYRAALDWGADYFLQQPFEIEQFFTLVEKYFEGTLKKNHFLGIGLNPYVKEIYDPIAQFGVKYLKFWGTRGSISVSGPDFDRYGGNTCCLEVHVNNSKVIIDAGTGIIPLGKVIDTQKFPTLDIFISHTHLDHVIGFPFFEPLYKENVTVNVWAPVSFEKSTEDLFTEMLAYAFFPVRLDEMKAKVHFKDLRDSDKITIGDISIECGYSYHPGPTLGFKIRTPNKSFGYVTDNEFLVGYHGPPWAIDDHHPLLKPHERLIALLQNDDFLIHEAQYFTQEYHLKVGWGHSTIANASVLAKLVNAKHWLVTHHDPNHSDEDLQVKYEVHRQILEEAKINVQLRHATDNLIVPL